MVDLVVPVSAPGATSGASELDRFAVSADKVAIAGEKVAANGSRMNSAFRSKAAGAAAAGASFNVLGKHTGQLAGRLANLSGLIPGVGGRLASLGALAGGFGPLGIAVGVVAAAIGFLADRAEKAKKKLEDIANLQKSIAEAGEKRKGLVADIAGITQGAGAAIGGDARSLIAAGGDPRNSSKLINATTDANQAIKLDTLLTKSGLSTAQTEQIAKTSALIGRAGGDRLESAGRLIDQLKDTSNGANATGGIFGPGRRRGISTARDRLLDAAGQDPGSDEGQTFANNLHSGLLSRLDQTQAGVVSKNKELIGNAFSSTGLEAVDQALRDSTPAIKENTDKIKELDKTIKDMTKELKELQKPKKRTAVSFTGLLGYAYES